MCLEARDAGQFKPDRRYPNGYRPECLVCLPAPAAKACAGSCGRTLPSTEQFFHPFRTRRGDGLRAICRSCYNEQRRKAHQDPDDIDIPITIDEEPTDPGVVARLADAPDLGGAVPDPEIYGNRILEQAETSDAEIQVSQPADPPKIKYPPGTKPPAIPDDAQAFEQEIPERLIIQSDDHHPIQDRAYEAALFAFARDWKPDVWVHAGDRYDLWSLSRFEKEPDRWLEPGGRLQEEFDSANQSWNEMVRISRRVHFIKGNHENRLEKLVAANPGLFRLAAFDWHRLADIPHQVQIHKYGTILNVGGIHVEHGDRIGGKFGVKHAAEWVLTNVPGISSAFGHTHRLETKYRTTLDPDGGLRTFVAHNLGHGSDVSKQAYAGLRPNWQHGFLAVEFFRVAGKVRYTPHPVPVIDGKFSIGGRLYDGHACQ